jgi:alkylation response protein AidB-like acyl-CoA dehydrogenase
MEFTLNEEQEMLKTSVRDFLTTKCPKTYVKQMEADDAGYTKELWKEMAGLGWQGLALPEKYGGSGMKLLDLALLVEEIGRACLPGPFFSTVILGALTLSDFGSEAQKHKYLPGVAAGNSIATFAITEKDARFEAKCIQMKAVKTGTGYSLNGTKLFVSDAHIADWMLVAARTEEGKNPEDGITVFIVDAKTPGISTTLLKTMAHDKLCEVEFKDVHIPAENIVGEAGKGWAIVTNTVERAAIVKCCDSVGVMQRAFEMTLDYAKDRKQFGKIIGSFQVLQHYLSDIFQDCEGSRFASYHAAWRMSEGKSSLKETAAAKVFTSDAFERIVTKAHQIHGAVGVTIDHDLHFYTTRGKAAQLSYGSADHWREVMAKVGGL